MADTNQISSLKAQFARICDTDTGVDVFAFLSEHPTATLEEQMAVLLVDQARSWRLGSERTVENYLAQLPVLKSRPDLIVQLAVEEFGYREERGHRPYQDEYLQRFPDCAEPLRALLEVRSSSGQLAETPPTVGDSTLIASQPSQVTETYAPARAAPQPQLVGGCIGDYEILGEIARGGMGVVYKAHHRSLGRLAAVKLIRSGEMAHADEVRRFQLEAQAAAQLDHPGIVPVFEVGQQGNQHFMAMAYVEGQSLWQIVKEAPLEPRHAARLIQQVAEAVQYAHNHGIIHRDLKPQNILLTIDGQSKVTDFGLAKNQSGDASLTGTGDVLGTPSYMPPEQATGKTTLIGPLADVYSLGATLYCLLTGRPPFQAANTLETLMQVVEQEPVPPRQLNRSVPVDLETICLKCLEKNPPNRYSSAEALALDLKRFQCNEPIQARPVSRFERAWRRCRRNPVGTALAVSFAIVLCFASVTVWLVQEQQQSRQASQISGLLESLLDRPTVDPSYIDQGESLLTALQVFAPDRINQDRTRLWQLYAKVIESNILQPKLSDDDEQQLATALDRLRDQEPTAADRMRKLLESRRRNWQAIVEVAAPFANREIVFSADVVDLKDRRLVRHSPTVTDGDASAPTTTDLVPTQVSAAGRIRLEATFDADWETADRIGIEFRYDERNLYQFVMTARLSANPDQAADIKDGVSFAAVRQSGGQFQVQILRNRIPLRLQFWQAATVPPGPLRLDAQRNADQLEFRVGTQKPLIFEDVFAIHSRAPAQFLLLWPASTSLEKLIASTMPISAAVNPLEAGDALFADGDFEAALGRYREAAIVTADADLQQEARYKTGVCLQQLQRLAEAAEAFESLIGESAPRWPMLAAIQLWVVQIRSQQRAQADAMFDVISNRYSGSDVVTLVPEDLRQEVIETYRPRGSSRMIQILTYDPQRVPQLQRYLSLLDLFGSSEIEQSYAQFQLIDAVWSAGNHDLALTMIRESDHRARSSPSPFARFQNGQFGLYLAAQFKTGNAAVVWNEMNAERTAAPDGWAAQTPTFWFCLAQCEARLGRWEDAGRSLQRGEQLLGGDLHQIVLWQLTAELLRGFLIEKAGDAPGAIAVWRAGGTLDPQHRTGYATWLHYLILRGLSGDVDRNDAELFIGKLGNAQSGTMTNAIRGILNADMLTPIVREVFRTPHGREIAWRIASGAMFPAEEAEAMVNLLAYEMIRQGAFEGTFSSDQHEMIWPVVQDVIQLQIREGKFATLQIGQSALAWKGTMNIFGWRGLAANISANIRGPLAYCLAHRMLRRTQNSDAAKLFDAALADAPPNSVLQKLARQDAELLKSGSGILNFRNSESEPAEVLIFAGNELVQRVSVDEESELVLPAGEYDWRIETAAADDISLSGRVTISTCGRRLLDLHLARKPI